MVQNILQKHFRLSMFGWRRGEGRESPSGNALRLRQLGNVFFVFCGVLVGVY